MGPKASSGVLVHRIGPRRMTFEAEFCSHLPVAVPVVPVYRVLALCPCGVCLHTKPPDVVEDNSGFDLH